MAEAEENLTPAEIRRRKILARGADRLSKITGQTTADTQYAEANAPAADAQESFVLQVPSDNPLDAWMNSAGPAPEAERDAAGAGADAGPGAAPAGSRPSASKSGPSLPPKRVGAAAVAAKSGDDIDSIRSETRKAGAGMRWSPVNAAGRGPITVRDALAYAAAVTGPVRVITCIAIATAASAHARGDLTVLFPRSWEAQVMAAVGLPYVREAVAALMTATRTMHPVLLLLALQAAVILTTLLMALLVARGAIRAAAAKKPALQGMLGVVAGMVPGVRTALAAIGAVTLTVGTLASDVAIFLVAVGVLGGVSPGQLKALERAQDGEAAAAIMGAGSGLEGSEGAVGLGDMRAADALSHADAGRVEF